MAHAAAEFDRHRQNKKLKKIGQRDLLIACITLANPARLISATCGISARCRGCRSNWAD